MNDLPTRLLTNHLNKKQGGKMQGIIVENRANLYKISSHIPKQIRCNNRNKTRQKGCRDNL